ncbi:MAG TPA: hypothetical protein VGI61_13330 [Parafilimonas sp.]|jgi:hypothetical protein
MKKIVLFLAIIITLFATTLHAQQNMQKMQEAWKSYLKDSVKLADPMVDSVMAIRMQYMPQMRQIFMDQSSSTDDKKTKMEGLRTEMDTRYKSAGLTDDQVQQIHAHEDALRTQMMNRMNNGGGGGQ